MPLAAFRKLNEERESQGLATFANPRNFTAGTVRQLEPSITAQRRMDYFAYMLLKDGQTFFDRQSKTMDALDLAGFKVNPNRKLAKNLDEVGSLFGAGKAGANRCPTRLMASSSKSTALPGSGSWVSPARLRAGRLPTSSRRAAR